MLDQSDLQTVRQEIDIAIKSTLEWHRGVAAGPQITLRDQLAMAALTSYLANGGTSNCTPEQILGDCYKLADAGLAVRDV